MHSHFPCTPVFHACACTECIPVFCPTSAQFDFDLTLFPCTSWLDFVSMHFLTWLDWASMHASHPTSTFKLVWLARDIPLTCYSMPEIWNLLGLFVMTLLGLIRLNIGLNQVNLVFMSELCMHACIFSSHTVASFVGKNPCIVANSKTQTGRQN